MFEPDGALDAGISLSFDNWTSKSQEEQGLSPSSLTEESANLFFSVVEKVEGGVTTVEIADVPEKQELVTYVPKRNSNTVPEVPIGSCASPP